jgi:hypothetical protein
MPDEGSPGQEVRQIVQTGLSLFNSGTYPTWVADLYELIERVQCLPTKLAARWWLGVREFTDTVIGPPLARDPNQRKEDLR